MIDYMYIPSEYFNESAIAHSPTESHLEIFVTARSNQAGVDSAYRTTNRVECSLPAET